MTKSADSVFDHQGGTNAPWYRGWDISEERRDYFRQKAQASAAAKRAALAADEGPEVDRAPRLDPLDLMPPIAAHHLPALSLFSGGGGLDLGFERAGFAHVA